MRTGVYPFPSTNDIEKNLTTIKKAIIQAAENSVRLLVFHECALCGYPPVESQMEEITEGSIAAALSAISEWAGLYQIFVAVGTVRFARKGRYNSIILFDDHGMQIGSYDKRALWGWDTRHFLRGNKPGIFEIDQVKVGFRICFDIRFPELFRELYRKQADLCFVSFSDTAKTPSFDRYDRIKAHLITRASENVMPIVSVNSLTNVPTAPTAVFDWNGHCIKEAKKNAEGLLVYDFQKPERSFGMEGRIVNNQYFLKNSQFPS